MSIDLDAAIKDGLLKSKAEEAVAIVSTVQTADLERALFTMLIKERGMQGIVMCIDRPPAFYDRILAEISVPQTLSYLDTTGSGSRGPNIQHADNIADLNSLSIDLFNLITTAIKRQPRKRAFMVFDALTAMQLYIRPEQFSRFMHATNLRLRALKTYQIYLIDGSQGTSMIKQFCDTILELRPEEQFGAALSAHT